MATRRFPGPVFAAKVRTPLGWLRVAATPTEVVAVSLAPHRWPAVHLLPEPPAASPAHALLEAVLADLGRHLRGERVDLSAYPVALSAQPPFVRAVLEATRRIPYGEVRSYAWVARQVGRPRAARAAGQALARNPVPLLVPCHRVVGAGGRLTGFGGGLALKQALLELEGIRCAGDRVVG